ncbi:IclR family transcriptional regulator [Actinophytocola sp.]|uniref:IclR family transcriptional regulator n=1 Tax=Actinophytocola sp. TaxID=1872138 RepID=UPI003D6B505C
MAIIEYLAGSPRRHTGVREIARHLGIGPAAAQRLVSTLAECGVLTKDDSEGYCFADDFLRLTRRISARYGLVELADPALRELAAVTNETALFAEYDPARRQIMFTTMAESKHPVRYVAELHRWMSIHRAASGVAVMAYAEADQLEDAFAQAEDEMRAGTSPWRDRAELEDTLAHVREHGYAITSGQRVSGAVGIFAPIRTATGAPVADIGLNIPVHRFDSAQESDLAATVLRAASTIEARIG